MGTRRSRVIDARAGLSKRAWRKIVRTLLGKLRTEGCRRLADQQGCGGAATGPQEDGLETELQALRYLVEVH